MKTSTLIKTLISALVVFGGFISFANAITLYTSDGTVVFPSITVNTTSTLSSVTPFTPTASGIVGSVNFGNNCAASQTSGGILTFYQYDPVSQTSTFVASTTRAAVFATEVVITPFGITPAYQYKIAYHPTTQDSQLCATNNGSSYSIAMTLTSATSTQNVINIAYPITGSTGLLNFGLWYVNYGLATSTPSGSAGVKIFVNTTSTVSDTNYLWYDQESKNGTADFYPNSPLNRLDQIALGGYTSSTTYYAIAELIGDSGVLATSPVINFSIGNADTALVFPTFNNPLNASSTEPSRICTKAPFAYWCDLVALYNALTPTSTSSTLPVVGFTFLNVNASGTTSTISVISQANVTSMMGATTVTLMRYLLVAGIWGSVIIYLWERIKHLHI